MDTFRDDLRYALRQFRKSPGFTLAAVLTLALGIGANTALFSVVRGVLLRPLPFAHGSQIVHLGYREPAPGVQSSGFAVQEYQDYKQQSHALDRVVEYHPMNFVLLGGDEPDNVQVGVVSADFFDVLGVKPVLGRSFQAADDSPSAEAVLLLTYEYWRSRFGGDPSIVGRTLTLNNKPITVVGILPRLPSYPGKDDVYMPTVACPFRSSERVQTNRNARFLAVFGRIRPGTSLEQARADVATVNSRLRQEHPEVYKEDPLPDMPIVPAQDELTARFRPTLLILLGTVGLVLLIACANVANLALARMADREKEIAIRSAIGAGRGRLVRQVLTESTLLALLGGALGLLIAGGGVNLLVAFASRFTLRAAEVAIDGSVLAFTLAVSVLSGLLFGAAPAIQLARRSLANSLREGSGKATTGVGGIRFQNLLIVVQVAISFVLLIAAGLAMRGLLRLNDVNAGFKTEKVLVADIPLSFEKYRGPQPRRQFFETLVERLASQPGVKSVAMAGGMPLEGEPRTQTIHAEGADPSAEGPSVSFNTVSEKYFQTLGIPLLAGRTFTAQDRDDAPPVVIVNRSLAASQWPGKSAVGQRINLGGLGDNWLTVVGVVEDVRELGLDTPAGPGIYLHFQQYPAGNRLFLRTEGNPASFGQVVRETVHAIDPQQPVEDVRTLEQVRSDWLAPARLTALLIGLFAALAFAITALGIGGVVAFVVNERTQEIGIRSVLGARRSDIFGMVVRQGMAPVAAGLVLGIGGALLLTRLLTSLLYGVEPTDPVTFAMVSLGLLAIVSVACSLPARRATGVDPMEALRR